MVKSTEWYKFIKIFFFFFGGGRGQSVPLIPNTVNIHSLYYMCFSLVFVVQEIDLRSCYSPAHPGNRAKRGMVPKFRRNKQPRLFHSGSRVLYVCLGVYVHVYGKPVSKYVQREREVTVTEVRAGRVAQGKACLDG